MWRMVHTPPPPRTTFRSRDPPHPLMATRMNRSLPAQSVRKTPSGVLIARSYRGKSMTDATLHHVRTEPIPAPGTSFPCGGPVGTSAVSMTHLRQAGHWELTSRRRSPIAAKHTQCCELVSVFRRDVSMIQTKLAFCLPKADTNHSPITFIVIKSTS